MLALLTSLVLLTAAPDVAVVKHSTEGVSDEAVAAVMRQVADGLRHEGLATRILGSTCKEPKCLADLVVNSKVAAIVGVTIFKGRRDLTLDLEATNDRQHQLAQNTCSVPFKGEPLPPDCAEFFRTLKVALGAPPPKAPEDAPRVVQLEPNIEARSELIQINRSRGLLRVSAVTTIASGAAGLGLFLASALVKGQLDGRLREMSNGRVSGISRDEAHAKANLANGLGNASIVALAVAGLAAVTTGVLWLKEDSGEPPTSEE